MGQLWCLCHTRARAHGARTHSEHTQGACTHALNHERMGAQMREHMHAHSCLTTGLVARQRNLAQISFACTSAGIHTCIHVCVGVCTRHVCGPLYRHMYGHTAALSDTCTYPTFVRTTSSWLDLGPRLAKTLLEFGWRQCAILGSTSYHMHAFQQSRKDFEAQGIRVNGQTFTHDTDVKHIKPLLNQVRAPACSLVHASALACLRTHLRMRTSAHC